MLSSGVLVWRVVCEVKRDDWQIESVSLDGQQIQAATIKPSFPGSGQSEDFHQR